MNFFEFQMFFLYYYFANDKSKNPTFMILNTSSNMMTKGTQKQKTAQMELAPSPHPKLI